MNDPAVTPHASGALHSITPYLMYRDAARGIEFCVQAFGARELMRHTEAEGAGQRIAHAQVQIGDSLLMVSQSTPSQPDLPDVETVGHSPVSLFLEVDDADATVARALALGAALVHSVQDQPYGRSGSIRDPFGYLWHVTSQPRTPLGQP